MCARILAHAVTKSIDGLSSLSQISKGFSLNWDFKTLTVSANTFVHLLIDHGSISNFLTSVSSSFSVSPPWDAASSQESGTGGFRVFHRFAKQIQILMINIYSYFHNNYDELRDEILVFQLNIHLKQNTTLNAL